MVHKCLQQNIQGNSIECPDQYLWEEILLFNPLLCNRKFLDFGFLERSLGTL